MGFWYAKTYAYFTPYQLALIELQGKFQVAPNGNVQLIAQPEVVSDNVPYGNTGTTSQVTPTTDANGHTMLTIHIKVASSYSSSGLLNTLGNTITTGAMSGVIIGGTYTWYTGPGFVAGSETGGIIGGVVGLIGGVIIWGKDFSDWNAQGSVDYTVSSCVRQGKSTLIVQTTREVATTDNNSTSVGEYNSPDSYRRLGYAVYGLNMASYMVTYAMKGSGYFGIYPR